MHTKAVQRGIFPHLSIVLHFVQEFNGKPSEGQTCCNDNKRRQSFWPHLHKKVVEVQKCAIIGIMGGAFLLPGDCKKHNGGIWRV